MLGSFVRAVSGYNPFGKAGDSSNDNAGGDGYHMNNEDGHHQTTSNRETRARSRRNLEVEVSENDGPGILSCYMVAIYPIDLMRVWEMSETPQVLLQAEGLLNMGDDSLTEWVGNNGRDQYLHQ